MESNVTSKHSLIQWVNFKTEKTAEDKQLLKWIHAIKMFFKTNSSTLKRMKDHCKSCSQQKIKNGSQNFIMQYTGHSKPFKTTMHNQTPGNANQLTWKQERKLLNRLLGREQVSLRCGPERQGNGLGSLSQTQNWRCWHLPACCCGLHFQCLICSPHEGSKLIHEFCSSGVELLPMRKTGNRKEGGIFMDLVNVSSDFSFPTSTMTILWYLLSLEWVRGCVCACARPVFHLIQVLNDSMNHIEPTMLWHKPCAAQM